MSLPNIQVVIVVMHLINIIMPKMRRHWWRGRAKTAQSSVSGWECLGRAVVSHSADDVKEFDELAMAISLRSSTFASIRSFSLYSFLILFPLNLPKTPLGPIVIIKGLLWQQKQGLGKEGRLRMQQVNSKALIYTCSHMITVDDASFMNL